MLKMPNVMRNLHGISIWKTLQAFYSFSTNILENLALSQRRTCRPPPLRNDPHHFLIEYDAQCSESNENMNKKIFRFLFFELSSIFHSIFSEK